MSIQLQKLSVHKLESRNPEDEAEVAAAIGSAFGPGGPGILLVNGLKSEFSQDREVLLEAAKALAVLPENKLKELEVPDAMYSTGWSRGHESFKGFVDTKKGSFYANPLVDDPAGGDANLVSRYPHYMNRNIWPTDESCALLESSFKQLGSYINNLGLHIARHCDRFIKGKLGDKAISLSLEASLRESRAAKGRLLNYFPSQTTNGSTSGHGGSENPMWCGYHNDHGTITGLISGQFYNFEDQTTLPASPDPSAGLYVWCRGRDFSEKVSIPAHCIAFQIGESAQIMSGGVLTATPHGVRMPEAVRGNIGRATLAVFLQPNPWDMLQMPDHLSPEECMKALETSDAVPSMHKVRYEAGDTFGQFATKTYKAYCS